MSRRSSRISSSEEYKNFVTVLHRNSQKFLSGPSRGNLLDNCTFYLCSTLRKLFPGKVRASKTSLFIAEQTPERKPYTDFRSMNIAVQSETRILHLGLLRGNIEGNGAAQMRSIVRTPNEGNLESPPSGGKYLSRGQKAAIKVQSCSNQRTIL